MSTLYGTRGGSRAAMLLAAILFTASIGCNGPKFCCLEYELTSPEQSYCNAHSRAAGKFLFDAEETSSSALNTALVRLELLTDSAESCQTVACIENLINTAPDLGRLWHYYGQEHPRADSNLVSKNVAIDDARKSNLIRCGFIDAVQRTRKNIDDERI